MKTLDILLKTLTNDELLKLSNRYEKENSGTFLDFLKRNDESEDKHNFLRRAFIWVETNEGLKYWQQIDLKIREAFDEHEKSEKVKEMKDKSLLELIYEVESRLPDYPQSVKRVALSELLRIVNSNI